MRCREKKKHFLGPNIDINVSSRGFVALVPFRGLSQGPPAKPKRAIEVDAKPCMVLVRPVSFFHRTPDHDDCQQPTPPCLLQTLDSACSAADQRDPEPAPGTWHLVFAFHPSIPLLCGGLTRFFFFCLLLDARSLHFFSLDNRAVQNPGPCPLSSRVEALLHHPPNLILPFPFNPSADASLCNGIFGPSTEATICIRSASIHSSAPGRLVSSNPLRHHAGAATRARAFRGTLQP